MQKAHRAFEETHFVNSMLESERMRKTFEEGMHERMQMHEWIDEAMKLPASRNQVFQFHTAKFNNAITIVGIQPCGFRIEANLSHGVPSDLSGALSFRISRMRATSDLA